LNSRCLFTFLLALALGLGAARGQEASGQELGKSTPAPDFLNPRQRALGNGQWWMSLSAKAKGTFVDGYKTAMNRASEILFT
jgi:hypothetical protein